VQTDQKDNDTASVSVPGILRRPGRKERGGVLPGETDTVFESKEALPEELSGMSDDLSHVFVGDDFTFSVPDNYWIRTDNNDEADIYTVNDDVKDYIEKVSPFGNNDTSLGSNYWICTIVEHVDYGMDAAGVFDDLYDESSSSQCYAVTPEHLSQPAYVIISKLPNSFGLRSDYLKTVKFYLDEPGGTVFGMGGIILNQEMEEVFLDIVDSLEYTDQ